jgi:hypothetical protein
MIGRDERTIRAALAIALARGCILCHEPAAAVGVFEPDDPAGWGAKPGRGRVIAYGLCGRCAEPPADLDAIERVLARGRRAA